MPELDAFLITSETEGLGTSVIDAFVCKVPVVATNAGGIPELVKHKETGLLAEVKDAKTLADNINLLFSDSINLEEMAKNQQEGLNDQSFLIVFFGVLVFLVPVIGVAIYFNRNSIWSATSNEH